jgi:hypothetical protein
MLGINIKTGIFSPFVKFLITNNLKAVEKTQKFVIFSPFFAILKNRQLEIVNLQIFGVNFIAKTSVFFQLL